MDQQTISKLLQLPEELPSISKTEQDYLKETLSNPAVQKYFRTLHFNALRDLADNEVTSKADEEKLAYRFMKLKGIQMVCLFIINNFGKENK